MIHNGKYYLFRGTNVMVRVTKEKYDNVCKQNNLEPIIATDEMMKKYRYEYYLVDEATEEEERIEREKKKEKEKQKELIKEEILKQMKEVGLTIDDFLDNDQLNAISIYNHQKQQSQPRSQSSCICHKEPRVNYQWVPKPDPYANRDSEVGWGW